MSFRRMALPLSSPTSVPDGDLPPSSSGLQKPSGLDHRAMETIRSLDRSVEIVKKIITNHCLGWLFFWNFRNMLVEFLLLGA